MSSDKLSRRSVIGRLVVASAGIFTFPWLQSKNKDSNNPQNNDSSMSNLPKKTVIKHIFPLGFQWESQDPFLFCVHHEDHFPKGSNTMGPDPKFFEGRQLGDDFIIKDGFRMYHGQTVPGFPGHPHRGFETITVVRKGFVDHADSMGASGRYGNGDVQWMTAGKGVQHSEMFPLLSQTQDNPMELFQVWLNLPRKDKMVAPHFKMLWKEAIPNLYFDQGKVLVELIAGNWEDYSAVSPPPNSWAANVEHNVLIVNIKMQANSTVTLPLSSETTNRSMYFYEGDSLQINETSIKPYSGIYLNAHVHTTLRSGNSPTSVFILQGEPISEPVIQYGPFVMNTKQEIQNAFDDYHRTKFGGWPWSKYDQVHDRFRGRFAKHADGKLEEKDI